MPLTFVIDAELNSLSLCGPILNVAVNMALRIASTNKYAESLIHNISDDPKPTITDVLSQINSLNIIISYISLQEHMDTIALVYRKEHPNHIFLNPLLLLQLKRAELNLSDDLMRKYSLFVAAKLVHELSLLLHPNISANLRRQVKKRSQHGEGKKKMTTPEKSKGGAMFGDFGEMIEYDIFGGILEIFTFDVQPIAFFIDELILYKHPLAKAGRLVVVKETDYEVTPGLEDLQLNLGAEQPKPYTGPRGHLCAARFSSPSATAESDAVEGDDGDDFTRLEATF